MNSTDAAYSINLTEADNGNFLLVHNIVDLNNQKIDCYDASLNYQGVVSTDNPISEIERLRLQGKIISMNELDAYKKMFTKDSHPSTWKLAWWKAVDEDNKTHYRPYAYYEKEDLIKEFGSKAAIAMSTDKMWASQLVDREGDELTINTQPVGSVRSAVTDLITMHSPRVFKYQEGGDNNRAALLDFNNNDLSAINIPQLIEDGFMKDKHDVYGLKSAMVDSGILLETDIVLHTNEYDKLAHAAAQAPYITRILVDDNNVNYRRGPLFATEPHNGNQQIAQGIIDSMCEMNAYYQADAPVIKIENGMTINPPVLSMKVVRPA